MRARRRLIGAIILVTAIVVALPMVLDSEPKPESQDISIRIPAPDSGTFTPKVASPAPAPEAKPAPVAVAPAQKPPGAPSAPSAAPKSEPRTPPGPKGPKPVVDAPQKAAVAAPAKAAPDAGKPGSQEFVVQVVALSDGEKARQMQQQISAAGIKSYTEVVKTEKGDVTRVRVGPFASREEAEKARGPLKAIGLDGKVIAR